MEMFHYRHLDAVVETTVRRKTIFFSLRDEAEEKKNPTTTWPTQLFYIVN